MVIINKWNLWQETASEEIMALTATLYTPEPGILHTCSVHVVYTTTSDTGTVQLPVEWGAPDNLIASMTVIAASAIEQIVIASYDTATGIATIDRKKVEVAGFASGGTFDILFIWYNRLPGGAQ